MNYGPFRGLVELDLRDIVYAVVGCSLEDQDASNGAGKSTLVAALSHVLFGRPPRKPEDAWITDGEGDGHVAVTFDDGTRVTRQRTRGRSTKLTLDRPDGTKASGDLAEEELARLLSMGEKDFFLTAFTRQKKADAIVTMDPEPRWKVVSAWLGLDKADVAKKHLADKLAAVETARESKRGELAAHEEQMRRVAKEAIAPAEFGYDPVDHPAEATNVLEVHVRCAEDELLTATARAEQALARIRAAAEHAQHAKKAARLDEVVREGKALAPVEATLPVLEEQMASAEAAEREQRRLHDRAHDTWQSKVRLARGDFDGKCPLLEGLDCPAKTRINSARAEHEAERLRAETDLDNCTAAHSSAKAALSKARQERDGAKVAKTRLEALRAERDRLKESRAYIDAHGPPDPNVAQGNEARAANEDLAYRRSERDRMVASLDRFRTAERAVERLRKEVEGLDAAAETARLAASILDQARRSVAETGVSQIVGTANNALAEAGADIRVEARWEREADGLADACGSCGAAMPKSQRVKACASCGADRGQKSVRRLDFVLTPRSGGLEDLAGFVIQLAAWAYIREVRQLDWSTAVLDEVGAGLDAVNRRVLGTHLVRMLGSKIGARQAFVVSHHAATLDALPARIIVKRGPGGSSLEVRG